jgi:hypothetical protein
LDRPTHPATQTAWIAGGLARQSHQDSVIARIDLIASQRQVWDEARIVERGKQTIDDVIPSNDSSSRDPGHRIWCRNRDGMGIKSVNQFVEDPFRIWISSLAGWIGSATSEQGVKGAIHIRGNLFVEIYL